MALMDFDRIGVGRLSKAPSPASRTPLEKGRRSTWWRSALKVAGTLFVLLGIAIGILTLRLALVLWHGVLY